MIVSNILCYAINKFKKVPVSTLKPLILDFYSSNIISSAKELLVVELEKFNVTNAPKITRKHRDGSGKNGQDLDEIFSIIIFLDENSLLGSLPQFVASSPDEFPSMFLTEGDLNFLFKKIKDLESLSLAQENQLKELISFKSFCLEKFASFTASSSVSNLSSSAPSFFPLLATIPSSGHSYGPGAASSPAPHSSVNFASVLKQGPLLAGGSSDGDSEGDTRGYTTFMSKSGRRAAKRLSSPLQADFLKRPASSSNHIASSSAVTSMKSSISASQSNMLLGCLVQVRTRK